jgi:hypothetical protein
MRMFQINHTVESQSNLQDSDSRTGHNVLNIAPRCMLEVLCVAPSRSLDTTPVVVVAAEPRTSPEEKETSRAQKQSPQKRPPKNGGQRRRRRRMGRRR